MLISILNFLALEISVLEEFIAEIAARFVKSLGHST